MRYIFILIAAMFIGAEAKAEVAGVYQSTWSATSLNDRALCGGGDRGYLHRVCVVDAVAASTAAVYNSSYTVNDAPVSGTQNLTGNIDGSEPKGCMDFGLKAPNGLFIDQFGTAGYTVIYDCYR